MIKKFFCFFLLSVVAAFGPWGCRPSASERPARAPKEAPAVETVEQRDPTNLDTQVKGRSWRRQHRWRGEGEASEALSLTEEQKKSFGLQMVSAARREMRSRLQAMGKILAPLQKRAIVSYAFPARIAEVHVALGDWVKAGQKLVTLQSEEVGEALAAFYKAEADFELAAGNLERERNLHERGVGAKKNLLSAEAEFKAAAAGREAAEKKLHLLGFSEEQVEELKDNHRIRPLVSLEAPVSGKIIACNAVRGAMIDQYTEILSILDPTVLWVDAEIFERDIAKLKLGQEVRVRVPAYPGEDFHGKVSYIGDVLKEETRTVTVRTEVPNRNGKLKPGMFADMTIFLDHRAEVLAVPERAVLDDGKDKIVFIRAGQGFRPQIVQLGMKDDGFWEIVGGLQPGQEVVVSGNYQLKSKLYDEILKAAGVH